MAHDGNYVGLFSKSGAEESRSHLKHFFKKKNSVIADFVSFNGYDLLGSSFADVKNNTWITQWSGAVIF